jgi:hypothetical protein
VIFCNSLKQNGSGNDSHGRGHWFNPSIAHHTNAQATPQWPFLLETPSDQITGENDFAASNVAKAS